MAKRWRCLCGSADLTITRYSAEGSWFVNAECNACEKLIRITKHGIRERRSDAATKRIGK